MSDGSSILAIGPPAVAAEPITVRQAPPLEKTYQDLTTKARWHRALSIISAIAFGLIALVGLGTAAIFAPIAIPFVLLGAASLIPLFVHYVYNYFKENADQNYHEAGIYKQYFDQFQKLKKNTPETFTTLAGAEIPCTSPVNDNVLSFYAIYLVHANACKQLDDECKFSCSAEIDEGNLEKMQAKTDIKLLSYIPGKIQAAQALAILMYPAKALQYAPQNIHPLARGADLYALYDNGASAEQLAQYDRCLVPISGNSSGYSIQAVTKMTIEELAQILVEEDHADSTQQLVAETE